MHNMQHLCHTKSTIASPQSMMMVTLGPLARHLITEVANRVLSHHREGQSQIFRIWTKINIYAERLQQQHEIGNLRVIILITASH